LDDVQKADREAVKAAAQNSKKSAQLLDTQKQLASGEETLTSVQFAIGRKLDERSAHHEARASGCVALAAYLWSGRSVVHPKLSVVRFRWPLFRDILRVGAVAALVTVATNLTIIIGTSLVGEFGPAAIAGYGTGARLEYLLVPLVFGFGGPMVAMVGTSIGAGKRERALRTAWIGAAMAAVLTEAIGLCAAAFPTAWLSLFDTNPEMLDAGVRYLRIVGPFYGMIGLALSLYFASQGAGRLLWPLIANLTRLAIAALAGWLALRSSGNLSYVFLAQSLALVAFGLINALAIASGSWFGPLTWPWSGATALQRRS